MISVADNFAIGISAGFKSETIVNGFFIDESFVLDLI